MKKTFSNKSTTLIMLIATIFLVGCESNNTNANENIDQEIFENFTPVISATGTVVPEVWATLSISTGGTVSEIFVEENAVVKKGDVLIQFEGTERLAANLSAAELELISAKQALQTIQDNSALSEAEALQALTNAQDSLRDMQIRLNYLVLPAGQENIDEAYANLVIAENNYKLAKQAFKQHKDRPETNVNRARTYSAMIQAEKLRDAALRTYNYMTGGANEIDVAQAEANVAYAQAALDVAVENYETLINGIDPEIFELAEARVKNAQNQYDAAQAALDDLTITAPFSGTITQVFVKESEWVNPGQAVIIIGDLSSFQIETTDLNEIDVARIQVGSLAIITFDAISGLTVEAQVIRIATKSSPGTGVNYKVILELLETPENLLWGMTAFVDIETE